MHVAAALQRKVYVAAAKRSIMGCLDLPPQLSALLTTNHLDANIHAVSPDAEAPAICLAGWRSVALVLEPAPPSCVCVCACRTTSNDSFIGPDKATCKQCA